MFVQLMLHDSIDTCTYRQHDSKSRRLGHRCLSEDFSLRCLPKVFSLRCLSIPRPESSSCYRERFFCRATWRNTSFGPSRYNRYLSQAATAAGRPPVLHDAATSKTGRLTERHKVAANVAFAIDSGQKPTESQQGLRTATGLANTNATPHPIRGSE